MTTKTFSYTGAVQQFTVPDQVTSITATLVGGNAYSTPAPGKVVATFAVTPGQVINVYCGGSGGSPTASGSGQLGGTGGWNGGGNGGNATGAGGDAGYGGGGATDIRIGGTALANRVLVAAGAGGFGRNGGSNCVGGDGGASTGAAGLPTAGAQGGGGGTQAAGGAAGTAQGTATNNATAGALGQGGNGSNHSSANICGGGGGGGGYYGGGGGGGNSGNGTTGGGGGGSNYIAATINGSAPTSTASTRGEQDSTLFSKVTFVYDTKPTADTVTPDTTHSISTSAGTSPFAYSYVDDAGITPTAYQIVVTRNDTGATLLDTGKVVSTSTAPSLSTASFVADIPLAWKVRAWDSADKVSDYSANEVFYFGTPPTWTPNPANGASLTSGKLSVGWTDAVTAYPRSGGTWRVLVTRVSDSAVIRDVSGTNYDTTKSWYSGADILTNGASYNIAVTLTDSAGIARTQTSTVTTSYTPPASPSYTINDYTNTLGYVEINWTATSPALNFYKWRLWRKVTADAEWTLVYETLDPNNRIYHDYLVESGSTYMWNVTQSAIVSGTEVQSLQGTNSTGTETRTFLMAFDAYWIIDTTNEVFSTKLYGTVSADLTEQFEENSYVVIGRGRKKDLGTRLGYSGQLQCQLRGYDGTPELIRAKLEGIRKAEDTAYYRSPFGDLFACTLGEMQFTLVPGVNVAMYDVSIPIEEVVGPIYQEMGIPISISIVSNGDQTNTATFNEITPTYIDNGDDTTTVVF